MPRPEIPSTTSIDLPRAGGFGFSGSAVVSTKALRNRLPRAFELLELQLSHDRTSPEQVDKAKAEMRDFVNRCACIEGNTGLPVTFVGMW